MYKINQFFLNARARFFKYLTIFHTTPKKNLKNLKKKIYWTLLKKAS